MRKSVIKKAVSLLVALGLMVGGIPAFAQATEEDENSRNFADIVVDNNTATLDTDIFSNGKLDDNQEPPSEEVAIESELGDSGVLPEAVPEGVQLGASLMISPFSVGIETLLNFTSIKLYKEPASGDNPSEEINGDIVINPSDKISIVYEWDIPNGITIDSNETYTFQLPASFNPGATGITAPLLDFGGAQIGDIDVDEFGLVSIKFTDATFNDPATLNRKGKFYFTFNFSSTVQEGPPRQDIDLGFTKQGQVHFGDDDLTDGIEKTGNTDPAYNSKQIFWEIDVNLDSLSINNPVVTDDLPAGLVVTEIKVFELGTVMDPSVEPVEGAELTAVTDYTYTPPSPNDGAQAGTFTVALGANINSAYRIKLTTKMIDDNAKDPSFVNTATLSGTDSVSNEIISIADTVTVTNDSKFGENLAKDGSYDKFFSVITWKIKFNYGQNQMVPLLQDGLSGDINSPTTGVWSYDMSSFEVYEVTFGPTGSVDKAPIKIIKQNKIATFAAVFML